MLVKHDFNPILVLFKQSVNVANEFIIGFQSYISLIQASTAETLITQQGTFQSYISVLFKPGYTAPRPYSITLFQSYISLIQASSLNSVVLIIHFNPILVLFKQHYLPRYIKKTASFQSYISLIQAHQ